MSDEEEIKSTEAFQNENKNKTKNKKIKNNNYQNIKYIDYNQNEDYEDIDIISKINNEAKKIKTKINYKNMKVFEKYHNLSIRELRILLAQKKEDILKLNKQKEKSKKTLNNLISKLNNLIKKHSYLIYEEESNALILNLEKTKEDKRKQLENSKKLKNLFKQQIVHIKEKISNNEKQQKKLNLIDNKINDLKKDNLLLKKEIKEVKSKKVINEKEVEVIFDHKKYPLKIRIKTDEMNNFASQKHDYFEKLNISLKSLDNISKEIKRFDELYNSSLKEDTDENVVKKINFWINLIKSDLNGDNNEILEKIQNGKSHFLNEIDNKNEINLNNNKTLDTFITMDNSLKSTHTEGSPQTIKTNYNKNKFLFTKESKMIKNRLIINKNKSSSLIFSSYNRNLFNLKKKKIPLYLQTNSSNSLTDKMALFKKLNFLKVNSPEIRTKYKLRNLNNKQNNHFISEEINDTIYNNRNNLHYIKPKTSQNLFNNLNIQELNSILSNDYKQISDADYRELIEKKIQYLESNIRLDKNINEIKKSKNKKLTYVFKIIKENENSLENIKNKNILLQKEVNNLSNIYKLSLAQYKIQNEILNRQLNKFMIKSESVKNEEKENRLIKSNEKIKENKSIDKDLIPKRKKFRTLEKNNSKKKIKILSREEQLKIIREKYQDEIFELNEDNDYQINENENNDNNINEEDLMYNYNNNNENNIEINNEQNNVELENINENKDNNEIINKEQINSI